MASAYTELGISSDPQDALNEMLEDMQERVPGWRPVKTSLIYIAFEIAALQIARVGAALEAQAKSDFSAYGQNVVQEPVQADEHAQATVTFTASRTTGVFIPQGTAFSGDDGAGGEVIFATTADASIPAPDASVSGIPAEAVDPGLLAAPITGTGTMISTVEGISGVAFDEPTTVGAGGETEDEYTDRLAKRLRLLKAGPVTPSDYDLFLRTSLDAVYRVLVRDTFDPSDHTDGHAGMLTLSMIDETGAWVGAPVDLLASQLIAQYRETDAVTNIIAPTITTIDVHYDIIVADGYDDSDVLDEADAAIAAFLSPATWGMSRVGEEPVWLYKPTFRPYGMLAPVIGNVEGVESVEAVTARTGVNAFANTPITLTGDAPLADLGACVGTVV